MQSQLGTFKLTEFHSNINFKGTLGGNHWYTTTQARHSGL